MLENMFANILHNSDSRLERKGCGSCWIEGTSRYRKVKKFRSVKIIHDLLHRIDYTYLAELFRFMGILVCEEILVERQELTQAEKSTDYNAVIYVGNRVITGKEKELLGGVCSAAEYDERIRELPPATIFFFEGSRYKDRMEKEEQKIESLERLKSVCHMSGEDQKSILLELVDRVLDSVFESDDTQRIEASQLEGLISIYVEHGIWLHSMNLQYFPKRYKDEKGETKKAFLDGHEAIGTILHTRPEDSAQHLYEYAKLWCEVKSNTVCSISGQILYFILEKLVGRCQNLCEKYPEFSNAKVLLGLCYETSPNYASESVKAFESALEDMDTECFASVVYYWIGKRCERYPETKKYAENYFKKANDSKIKFRNLFKLAIYARDNKEYDNSLYLFGQITQKLSQKINIKYEDPLELEYLFKSYVQQCYISHKQGKDKETIEYGCKALEFLDDEVEQNQYLAAFYGNDASRYRELIINTCDCTVVYEMIIESYKNMEEPEKKSLYQQKLQNYKKRRQA